MPTPPEPPEGAGRARGPASVALGAMLLAVFGAVLLLSGSGPTQAAGEGPGLAVDLPVGAAVVRVSPLVPRAPHGQAVAAEAQAFPQTTLAAREGRVRLVLGPDPLWVEEGGQAAGPAAAPASWGPPSPLGAHPATFRGEDPPFGLARDLGLGWHRGATAWWVDIQSEEDIARGVFNFEEMDRELAAMPPGMEALVNIMLPERLLHDQPRLGRARGPGGGPPPMPWGGPMARPEGQWRLRHSEEAYLHFVRTLVKRYDGSRGPAVNCWQFENEPDFSRAPRDWEGFARLQGITYQAIKEANPRATVLMGGLTVDAELGAFRRFYEPALASLQGGGLDAFDLHLFGPAEAWRELPGIYSQVRRSLDALGYAGTPIWMTECGTYSGQPTRGLQAFQSEREQAASLVKRLAYALNLGIAKVFWAWGVMEGFHHDDSFFDYTGLVYDGRGRGDPGRGVKKLAYHALRRLNHELAGGVRSLGSLDLGPGAVGLAFAAGGRRVYVLWADGPAPPPAPAFVRSPGPAGFPAR